MSTTVQVGGETHELRSAFVQDDILAITFSIVDEQNAQSSANTARNPNAQLSLAYISQYFDTEEHSDAVAFANLLARFNLHYEHKQFQQISATQYRAHLHFARLNKTTKDLVAHKYLLLVAELIKHYALASTHAKERVIKVDYRAGLQFDLAVVAKNLNLSINEVVTRHKRASYQAISSGFMPGFAYLEGLDPRLHQPRRERARACVPAGAVAIAGLQTAVYPFESPGGWLILGLTKQPLLEVLNGNPSAFIQPGDRVRFEELS